MPKRTYICEQCGKSFEFKYWDGRKRKYCSLECTHKAFKGPREHRECPGCGIRFEVRPNATQKYCSQKCYWGPREQSQCSYCGQTFEHKRSVARKFCSNECRWAGYEKPSNPVECTCHNCGKVFDKPRAAWRPDIQHHFCSLDCDHEWRRNGGNPSGEDHPEFNSVAIPCSNCGESLLRQPNRLDRSEHHFCDKDCFAEWRSKNIAGEAHPRWRGGHQPYYGPNWLRQARKARRRDGHECQICGTIQDEVGRKLDVHHITPLREYEWIEHLPTRYRLANRLSNLISLCPSCHQGVEAGNLPAPVRPT